MLPSFSLSFYVSLSASMFVCLFFSFYLFSKWIFFSVIYSQSYYFSFALMLKLPVISFNNTLPLFSFFPYIIIFSFCISASALFSLSYFSSLSLSTPKKDLRCALNKMQLQFEFELLCDDTFFGFEDSKQKKIHT